MTKYQIKTVVHWNLISKNDERGTYNVKFEAVQALMLLAQRRQMV